MNKNIELLNYIYQNAQMGQETLTQLTKIAEDSDFAALLQKHKEQYKSIFDTCDQMVNRLNAEPKGIGKMTELSTYFMISVETFTDKTSSHIAEMVIKGSVMGIVDIVRNLKKYQNADAEIWELGNKLLKIEESSVERYKAYL